MSNLPEIPQPDQYTQFRELVGSIRLPLKAMESDHLRVIAEALSQAFDNAQAADPNTVATGNEDNVTSLIQSHLIQLLDVTGCPALKKLVSAIARGAESINYNGTKINKRPDISITLKKRHPGFPLVIEAKIIDHHTGRTVKRYCDNGVRRYLNGDYGWACREAMMIAYVRDGAELMADLFPLITVENTSGTADFGTIRKPSIHVTGIGQQASSQHDRSFRYPPVVPPHQEPGPIDIWHIWLCCRTTPTTNVNEIAGESN